MADLDRVCQQGYAINDEGLVASLRSVAAPIRDHEGQVAAAINHPSRINPLGGIPYV